MFPLYLLNRLTFEFKFLCMCVWVMTIAHLGLKVKDIGQGQRGNAVGLTSILDRGLFFSSYSNAPSRAAECSVVTTGVSNIAATPHGIV